MNPSFIVPPLELHAAGRLIGAYRWIENQLFHVLGRWATTVGNPAVKLFLDQQSFEYAWHAELWADRLPDHRAASGLTGPPNPGVANLFRALLDDLTDADAAEKLSVVYRVVIPRLVVTYTSHMDRAAAAGNDPTQRALRLIVADESTAWRDGESHLQLLLTDEAVIARATAQQRRFEVMLVEAGGFHELPI